MGLAGIVSAVMPSLANCYFAHNSSGLEFREEEDFRLFLTAISKTVGWVWSMSFATSRLCNGLGAGLGGVCAYQ
jgi:hypothetical protein